MKPAAFRYHRPQTLEAALALLAQHGDSARPIAGGQSLVPMMNLRMAQPAELIDLASIEAMRGVHVSPDGLEIGAMVRHHEIEGSELIRAECPLLSQVAGTIGHYAIRQRGTLGGSLAHADPAAQWPLLATTLQAQMVATGSAGQRVIEGGSFFQSLMTTALQPDELLTAARFPVLEAGEGWSYQGFCRRSGDFAIVAVAVTLTLEAGRVKRLRLGVGGATPVPVRLDSLAHQQVGQLADAAWAHALGVHARAQVPVTEDPRIPAVFRQELIETLVTRAIEESLQRACAPVGVPTRDVPAGCLQ
ncbi:MAG: FAD binding domain-containing protein [Burkholderiales bacterium]|jgi:carbon-monoxide dehydrogenase medium subunit